MTSKQKDTIVTGLFNFEDKLIDIAVYYKSKNAIVVYCNNGNGYLSEYRTIKVSDGNLSRIESIPPKDLNLNPNQNFGLKLIYDSGKEKSLTNRDIILGEERAESKAPLRDFTMFLKLIIKKLTQKKYYASNNN